MILSHVNLVLESWLSKNFHLLCREISPEGNILSDESVIIIFVRSLCGTDCRLNNTNNWWLGWEKHPGKCSKEIDSPLGRTSLPNLKILLALANNKTMFQIIFELWIWIFHSLHLLFPRDTKKSAKKIKYDASRSQDQKGVFPLPLHW